MGVLGLTWSGPNLVWVWVGLAALAGYLLVAGRTHRARTSPGTGATGPLPDRAEYLRRWSVLHGDHDPTGSPVTLWWLTLVWRLARPLAARGVRPAMVTGWGLWAAAVVPAACAGSGRWPLWGVLAVVTSGVLDNLDGAVAVLSGRVSRFGYVLDSVADRCADTAYVLALFLLGAPGWLAVLGGGLAVGQEYTRARAGNAGMGQIGVVTVSERPTRVLVTVFTLLGAGLWPAGADGVATVGVATWTVLGLVGFVQVVVAVHAALRD